jgi:hypothetical protein
VLLLIKKKIVLLYQLASVGADTDGDGTLYSHRMHGLMDQKAFKF